MDINNGSLSYSMVSGSRFMYQIVDEWWGKLVADFKHLNC